MTGNNNEFSTHPLFTVNSIGRPSGMRWMGTCVLCIIGTYVATAGNPAERQSVSATCSLDGLSRKVMIRGCADKEPTVMRLGGMAMDPLKAHGSADQAATIAAMQAEPADGLYLVQFDGTRDGALAREVAEAGGRVAGAVQGNGFIVRLDGVSVTAVRSLRGIRWMGSYAPACRLSDKLAFAASRLRLTEGDDARVKVKAVLLGDADQATARVRVGALGEVLTVTNAGGHVVIETIMPVNRLAELAAVPLVLVIEYDPQLQVMNSVAADVCDVRDMWSTRGYYGSNEIVAVADSGLDIGVKTTAIHDDFEDGAGNSRVLAIYDFCGDGASDPYSGHGTHVAGSVLGNGTMSGAIPTNNYFPATCYAGMAPKAKLVFQAQGSNNASVADAILVPDDLNDLFRQVYTNGARIHQNSWGSPSYGDYTIHARNLDLFAFNNPDMLICFSSGNAGVDASPVDGIVDLGSVNSPSSAKNCITVGATENMRTGESGTWGAWWPSDFPVAPIFPDHVANNTNGMAAFSSRGPCSDGRIKPEIVAPGTYIASVRTHAAPIATNLLWGQGVLLSGNSNYVYSGGTSMACPLVSGCAAVLREYLRVARGMNNAPASLLKAILVNTAKDIAPGQYGVVTQEIATAPNNVEGWGRLTLDDSLFGDSSHRVVFWTNALSAAGVLSSNVTVYATNEPLRATLAWTDFPGSLYSVDHSLSFIGGGGLVNDLDLRVIDPAGRTNYPRAMDRFVDLFYYTNNANLAAYTSPLGMFEAERCTAPQLPLTLTMILNVLYDTTGAGGNYAVFIWADNGSGAPGATLFAATNTLVSGSPDMYLTGQGVGVNITTTNFFIGFQLLAANVVQATDPSSSSPRTFYNTGGGWAFDGSGDLWMHVCGNASTGDHVNAIEGVVIASPTTGVYRIETSGVNVPYGPARFAVAVSGILVPPPGAPFINITNADTTVGYLVTNVVIAGTNNADVVGDMRWTNTLTQVSGTLGATAAWSIPGIGLNVGSNVIIVSGTNVVAATAADTVTVVRAEVQPGELPPFVNITNADATVGYLITAANVGGTNNAHVIGGMRWTNTLTQVSGTLGATAGWSIPGIGLNVGSNVIIVSGTNLLAATAADTVTVVRAEAQQGELPPFVNVTNADATVGYPVTAANVAGTNNAHVIGDMRWTNTLTQVSGALGATAAWSISGIALDVGTNVIIVSGTNLLAATAADTVTVVRAEAQPGELAPCVNITNADAAVGYLVATMAIAGTNNAHVIGGMRWTNTLTQVSGALGATAGWTIPGVGLDVGTNVIIVSGTNLLAATAADTVTVVRAQVQPGELAPFVDITNAGQVVGFAVATLDCAGTNNAHVVGGMRWSNTLTQVSGTLGASASWSIPGIGLDTGSNVIIVTGTNLLAATAADTITVIRLALGEPYIDITNQDETVGYPVTTTAIGGRNNEYIVGTMGWSNWLTLQADSLPAATNWSIFGISLAVGTNVICVTGTNTAGAIASDTVRIVRSEAQPGELPPFIDITNETMVIETTFTCAVAGTNNNHVSGMMWVSNAANGQSTGFTAEQAWIAVPLPLSPVPQTNLFFVFGSNLVGEVTNDTVVVIGVPEAGPVVAALAGYVLLVCRRRRT